MTRLTTYLVCAAPDRCDGRQKNLGKNPSFQDREAEKKSIGARKKPGMPVFKLNEDPKTFLQNLLDQKTRKSTPEECWDWTGYLTSSGYGQGCKINQHVIGAHRLAYALAKGPIKKQMLVRHSCDNRKCINPNHLLLGTNIDNVRDRQNRNRQACGRKISSTLPTKTYETVCSLLQQGKPAAHVAKESGCSRHLVDTLMDANHWFNRECRGKGVQTTWVRARVDILAKCRNHEECKNMVPCTSRHIKKWCSRRCCQRFSRARLFERRPDLCHTALMPRKITQDRAHRQNMVLDGDRPLSDVTLSRDVVPKSLMVSVNGLLLPTSMWSYDAETRTVTVQSLLLKGDTVTAVGSPS